MKFLIFIAMLAICAGTSIGQAKATSQFSTPVRKNPLSAASVECTLLKGAEVDVLETSGTWKLIKLDFCKGWVSATSIGLADPPPREFNPSTDLDAQKWAFIVGTANDAKREMRSYFYRVDSLTSPENGRLQFWVRLHRFKDAEWQTNYEMQLFRAECRARKMKLYQAVEYDASGKSGSKHSFDDDAEYPWDDVIPDSVSDKILSRMCELWTMKALARPA